MSGFFPGPTGQYMAKTDIINPKTKETIASAKGTYNDGKIVVEVEPTKPVVEAASGLTTLDEKMKELSAAAPSSATANLARENTSAQSEVETLSSTLEKKGPVLPWQSRKIDDEEKEKLRNEEMKVRALNRSGRVDYCLQT